ncbi:MAG: glycosyltransferase [Candidatus Babeliaceae bacterium]|nr:glycosyltransferase [Candidatus Babeliaceae bacterium]
MYQNNHLALHASALYAVQKLLPGVVMTARYKNTLYALIYAQLLSVYGTHTERTISFIMPCYNADRLEHALASIYQQKIDLPFEVVCCDDGSTDDTFARLLKYKRNYPHLKVLRHATNKGAGAAANTCVKHSKGTLLYRLDSDNMLPEPELEVINKLVQLLDSSGCDAAMIETMVLFEGEKNIKALWRYEAPGNLCDLEHCITVAHDPAMSGNFLMRREAFERVGGYPEDHGSDTFRFGFKLYATGGKVALLPGSWYWHFYNPHGYWWREQKSGNNDLKALETVYEFRKMFTRTSQFYLQQALNQSGSVFQLIHEKKLSLK